MRTWGGVGWVAASEGRWYEAFEILLRIANLVPLTGGVEYLYVLGVFSK